MSQQDNARQAGLTDEISAAAWEAEEIAGMLPSQHMAHCASLLHKRLRVIERSLAAQSADASNAAPIEYLCNGTRFKLSLYNTGRARNVWPKELDGRWVALVAAEDDRHLFVGNAAAVPATGSIIAAAREVIKADRAQALTDTHIQALEYAISIGRHSEDDRKMVGATGQGLTENDIIESIQQMWSAFDWHKGTWTVKREEVVEFARALLAAPAAPAPTLCRTKEELDRALDAIAAPAPAAPKCTRCEYIGKCDCEPAPAAQAAGGLITSAMVQKALSGAWNDFVSDTGCYPSCFDVKPGKRIEADFERAEGAFLDYIAETLNAARQRQSDEADARDATRYRWLRSDDIEVRDGQHEISVVKHRLPFSDDPDETLTESALDEAIDAAMREQTGT